MVKPKSTMKIAFLWNFGQAKEIFNNWRDGLRAALEELAKINPVDVYLAEDCERVSNKYDFLLFSRSCIPNIRSQLIKVTIK